MEPSSSNSNSSPSVRDMFQILMGMSIGRCRASGSLCRISVSLKLTRDSEPLPSLRISVSDTGVGSSPEEFQDLADYIRNHPTAADRTDGVLHVTTTRIGDKDIYPYRLDLKEITPLARLVRLPTKSKNGKKFSGTEVSLSTKMEDDDIGDFLAWVTGYIRKILVLKVSMIVFELLVEHVCASGSKHECVIQSADGVLLPLSMSSTERLSAGLQDYVLKHGNTLNKYCISCFPGREHLKVGIGLSSSADNHKGTGQTVEAVIALVDIAEASNSSCSWTCSSASKGQQRTPADKNLVKKAIRHALVDMKGKYTGILLSCHASKVRGYVPDLSGTLAGLILSSKDQDFQRECASLLGLQPLDVDIDGRIESCIREKITTIIEMNDRKSKKERQESLCLFERGNIQEENLYNGDDEQGEGDCFGS